MNTTEKIREMVKTGKNKSPGFGREYPGSGDVEGSHI